MRQGAVRGWRGVGTCPRGHRVGVQFTLPDYGDAPALYQCAKCATILIVRPDAEAYVGPPWDEKRQHAACPSCSELLEDAWLYPDHFRCQECGERGSFVAPDRYPPDEESDVIGGWDAYG